MRLEQERAVPALAEGGGTSHGSPPGDRGPTVELGSEGRDVTVARLESPGATRVEERDKGPAGRWWVMRDPEDDEFCAS
ncbi:VOC family protein [Streptomyces sp. NPDC003480]